MANEDREIVLKLSIDGQEAISTIKLTDEEVKKLRSTTSETFTKAQGYVQNLGKDFDGVNVSIKELLERHSDLQAKLKSENIGGEAYQRWAKEIGIVEQELDKARAKIQASSLANEGLISETMKYAQVNDVSVKSISEYITSQNLSTETIQNSIRALELEIKTLAVNSEAWQQKTTASVNLRSALTTLTAGQSGFNQTVKAGLPGTNQMNMAVMQFGYALNDAQTFMINARMGMMGIANNIPMIVQNFIQAKNAAGGSATALQLVTRSIMGGGGLIIGINALMFAMQFLPKIFEDANSELAAFDKTIDSVVNNLVKLKNPMEGLEFSIKPEEIDKLTENIDQKIKIAQATNKTILANAGITAQGINVGYILGELGIIKGLSEKEQERLKTNEKLVEKLKEMKATLEAQKIVQETMNENDIKATKTKENKLTKEKDIPTAQELFDKEMEKTLPGSVFEALKPLAENEPEMLPDIKMVKEQELQKLKIGNIEDKFAREKALADWELQTELSKYEKFANYEEIRTELERQHSIKRREIAEEEANFKIAAYLQTLDVLRGAFAEHTAIAQAASIASTIIQTYQAATAALSPPPIGAGPLFGPILAAATIAAGMANIAKMESVKIPGYAEGGRLPKGESGFVEGYHNEIIAPEKTFVEVFRNELRPQIYNGGGMDSNSIIDLKKTNDEMKSLLVDLRDNGIKARAYLDDREARKIRSRANYLDGMSKL